MKPGIAQAILKLPADQQLGAALELVDLAFGGVEDWQLLRRAYRLERASAVILETLCRAAPHPVWRETLAEACKAAGVIRENSAPSIVDVHVCRLRARMALAMPSVVIATDWGHGYSVSVDVRPPRHGFPAAEALVAQWRAGVHKAWSAQDDADLIRMAARGDALEVIAEECDRSPRAVKERLAVLGVHRGEAVVAEPGPAVSGFWPAAAGTVDWRRERTQQGEGQGPVLARRPGVTARPATAARSAAVHGGGA